MLFSWLLIIFCPGKIYPRIFVHTKDVNKHDVKKPDVYVFNPLQEKYNWFCLYLELRISQIIHRENEILALTVRKLTA